MPFPRSPCSEAGGIQLIEGLMDSCSLPSQEQAPQEWQIVVGYFLEIVLHLNFSGLEGRGLFPATEKGVP